MSVVVMVAHCRIHAFYSYVYNEKYVWRINAPLSFIGDLGAHATDTYIIEMHIDKVSIMVLVLEVGASECLVGAVPAIPT